jgi:hypothetical protein
MHIINMVHHVMALRKAHEKRYKRLGFHLRRPWLQTLQDKHLKHFQQKLLLREWSTYVSYEQFVRTDDGKS